MPSARARLVLAASLLAASAASHAQYDASAPLPDDAYDGATAHPIYDYFAPRIFGGAPRAASRQEPNPAQAGALQGDASAWPLLYRDEALRVDASLAATLGLFAFRNNQFSVPASQAKATYANDPRWGEFSVEPALTAQFALSRDAALYGGVAYVESATRGLDYSGVDNTWHGDREQLYAGVRWDDKARRLGLDVSYGQQTLIVGRSLLVASGATNGEQRGASYVGPRTAWANAFVGKATVGDVTARAFWLKPNEASASYTGTRMSGIDVAWESEGPLRLGAMYLHVPDSGIATRDGLNVYNLRARWHPVVQGWLQGEYVLEQKSGVAAQGFYAALNYNATGVAWKPLATLRYAWMSGDKPGTAKWEGFDPLYFGGGNPDWYQGKLVNTLLNNTNMASLAATLTVTPDDRNILQLVAIAFRAVEIDAPLAVPAAYEPVATGGGVPARPLASELDFIWTYTFDNRLNVNFFAAYAAPGAGYKDLYASQGGSARAWSGFGMQLNVNY